MLHIALRICSVLLLAAVVTGTGEEQLGFSYKFYPEAGGWLKLNLVPANWAEARLRCNLEGAVLASPLNASLLNAMKEMMANHVSCGIYSGIHATISKGDYFSVEGVPLFMIPAAWAPNEPDNFEDSESCLMMLANGTMADVKCTEVFPYVCYKTYEDIVENDCGTIDNEYRLDTRTGSCYKFHFIGQTWSRAYMTCAAEGGYLGVINSAMESQVFKELIENYHNRIVARYSNGEAFIGFHDWDEQGTWRTIHGETLQNAGFASWASKQPDHWKGEEFCGSVFNNGLLNDINCHANLAFICEKTSTHQS